MAGEGDFSLTIDDRSLLKLRDRVSRKAEAAKRGLMEGRRRMAEEMLGDLKDATPYGEEAFGSDEAHEHARDGWSIEQRGDDLVIANHVFHIIYILKGNAPPGGGRIVSRSGGPLHFYDGGSEVFAMSVEPAAPNAEFVTAWERATKAAEHFGPLVVQQVMDAMRRE